MSGYPNPNMSASSTHAERTIRPTYFPADVLGPILQMLIADRYRYLKIEVGELREGGYSEVTTFYFSGKLDEDDLT